MKITNIEAFDLQEGWFRSLQECLKHGNDYVVDRGSFEGTIRKELDYVVIHITNPGNRPLVPVVAEGLPAPTSLDYIEDYLPYLLTSMTAPNEEYSYGQWIERQVYEVIDMLKKNPHTNQACITVGDSGCVFMDSPPCLRQIDIKIRDGKLHFFLYFRSWDAVGGVSSNLPALQLMKEWMVEQIGCEDGEMIIASKGLHIYQHSIDYAKAVTHVD